MNTALGCVLGVIVLGMWLGSAEAQLWVSVQDGGGVFGGAQIVQVIVDGDDELAEVEGEPAVTINGNALRMVQVTDARWHAYFADINAARAADATADMVGTGLDFGTICGGDSDANTLLGTLTQVPQDYFDGTGGVAFPLGGVCDATYGNGEQAVAVLNRNRDANVIHGIGQSIDAASPAETAPMIWPFVQLYDFGSGVTIRHDDQSVALEYGSAQDHAAISLDRTFYPPGADIHIEITNPLLNIDPTDRDSWTWDLDGDDRGRTIYRAFDSRGEPTGNAADISGSFDELGCQETCLLDVELGGGILEAVSNGNGETSLDGTGNAGLITLVETGSNTGVFVSYDSGNESALQASAGAPRGSVLDITYVDSQSITVGSSDATLEFDDGGAWVSGTRKPVILHDGDVNRNTKQKDEISVTDPLAVVPTIITGSPLTLVDAAAIATTDQHWALGNTEHAEIDAYGARALYTPEAQFDGVIVDFGRMRDGMSISPRVDSLLNYDMRSLGIRTLDIYVLAGNTPITEGRDPAHSAKIPIAMGAAPRNLIEITGSGLDAIASHEYAGLEFELPGILMPVGTLPLVADIVSFGINDDGARITDQVIRLELKETGRDTSMFAGTLEFMLASQAAATAGAYSDLATISDHAMMVADSAQDDVTLDYLDRANDGADRIVSGTSVPRVHTGTVSFDRAEYSTSDLVRVTLYDADLNTNSSTIESYSVGFGGGELLVLTLSGIVWTEHPGCDAPGPDLRLVETSESSGVFAGELKLPRHWCDGESTTPRNVAGTKIGITYADYATDTGHMDSTVFEPGDGPRINPFPLVIKSVKFADTDGGRIDVTVSPYGESFEFIVQITGDDGIVERIIEQSVPGAEVSTHIYIKWRPGAGTDNTVEAFALDGNGILLASPYTIMAP